MRIFFIVLLCLPNLCRAESAAPWGLKQLMQGFAQEKESKGRFVERKFLSVLNRPLESSGTLLFQPPSHVEKITLIPKKESLVLDRGVLTIDSQSRNIKRTLVLQEYPAIWALVESIRSTLAGDLPTLEHFYKVELDGDAAHWKMRLLPLDEKMRDVILEIRIAGRASRVDSFETLEASGDHALMQVTEDTP